MSTHTAAGYALVIAGTPTLLVDRVQVLIDRGWVVAGGIATLTNGAFAQAMVRK